MKYILIILFAFTTQAQNVWYVDANATGANTGRSWADAWTNMDSVWVGNTGINWYIIQGGDSIYISGGADSVLFPGDQYIRGSDGSPIGVFSPRVTIRPSWEEGHNGKVYFYNTTGTQLIMRIKNIGGLNIQNINFFSNRDPNGAAAGNVIVEGADSIHFDSCTFTNSGTGGALHLEARGHTVTNSVIQTLYSESPIDQDVLTFGYGAGGHTFRNNTIIQRNNCDSTSAHRDFIQVSGSLNDANMPQTIFDSNFLWCISPQADYWNATFYCHSGEVSSYQRWLFINNVIVINVADYTHFGTPQIPGGVVINADAPFGGSHTLEFYNNTLVTMGSGIYTRMIDSIWIKNNAFLQHKNVNPSGSMAMVIGQNDSTMNAIYKDIDYNHYYIPNWNSDVQAFTNANYLTSHYDWGEWQGLGFDVNSDTGYVDIVVLDSVLSSYMTPESLRGAGTNLSYLAEQYPEIMYDILGNPRPESGAWDIGALQYIAEGVDTIPNVFTFTPVTGATRNTVYNSNTNTLAGIDEGESCTIWIVDGEYQINSDAWTSSPGTISLGDNFRVRRTSHATLYSEPVSCTLYISTRSAVFTITTEAEPPPPTGPIIWLSTDGKKLTSQGRRLVFINEE